MDAYAVLGVHPAASDAEIRNAYLRRSKELHPDRYAGASDADRAKATSAMQELNAAYDHLRHRVPVEPAPAPTPPPSSPLAVASPPRRRRVAIVVAALFVASALIAVSSGNHTPGSRRSPNATVDLTELEGACITLDNAGGPDQVVDCTRPHDARVMRVVDHGTACPIWTDGSAPAGPTKDLCLDTHQ
jgi:hypothetical protein